MEHGWNRVPAALTNDRNNPAFAVGEAAQEEGRFSATLYRTFAPARGVATANDRWEDAPRSSIHWLKAQPGVESLNVAITGCIVNGPGESRHADIGISLPGTGETPAAPVFVDGKKFRTLRGPNIATEFRAMVIAISTSATARVPTSQHGDRGGIKLRSPGRVVGYPDSLVDGITAPRGPLPRPACQSQQCGVFVQLASLSD